jgi:hypothetical protein
MLRYGVEGRAIEMYKGSERAVWKSKGKKQTSQVVAYYLNTKF